MKPKFSLVILLVLIPIFAFTQENSIKLNTHLLILKSGNFPRLADYEPKVMNFNGIALAYRRVSTSSIIFQIESKIRLRNVDNDVYKYKSNAFHLRLEYGMYVAKVYNDKIRFSIVSSINVFRQNQYVEKSVFFEYPYDRQFTGIDFTGIMGMEYSLTKNIYLELDLCVTTLNVMIEKTKYYNPNFTPLLENIVPNVVLFGERFLRIGVGYRF